MAIPKSKKTPEEKAEISRANGAKAADKNRKMVYEKSDPIEISSSDMADMLADIYDPRAKVAPELKIQAAFCFMMTGTVKGTSDLTGLDHRLISEWKNKSQWWDTVLAAVKKEKQDELDAKFTEAIHIAVDELKDRLDNGDEVVVKSGDQSEIVKKAVGARDVAGILKTLYDSRSMLRGDPTSITRKETSEDIMVKLRKEFEQIADAKLDAKVVSHVPEQADAPDSPLIGDSRDVSHSKHESGEYLPTIERQDED